VVTSGNVLPSVTAAPLSTVSSTPAASTTLPPMVQASADDQLVLTLSKASKVNVQDSTGKTLVSGQQGTEQPLTLTGVSPFSITLDDADTVSLSLNGEKVDLKPYTVQGKAAFRLSR
jgi:cytoskeletal protein RodZ